MKQLRSGVQVNPFPAKLSGHEQVAELVRVLKTQAALGSQLERLKLQGSKKSLIISGLCLTDS